ncbi:MAG: hypothetical protein IPH99_09325 [Xanthomonadales bacterium]|nr:hypothetical protein [Xanthomonadales bacterium]
MEIETIRRVVLSRHLYELAAGSMRSANDMHLFADANLMQDAVEAFLVGLADHLQCDVDQNTKFDRYFVLINEHVSPKELPFKAKLLRLNRVRIDSKHHGIQPARDECKRLLVAVREFFEEASTSLLGRPFASISAIDVLRDGEPKELLKEAQEALANNDHEACAIACRKALFIEIERRYDISEYADDKPRGLLARLSSAPYYARNKEFIETNVREPTDFIVYDHARVDEHLLVSGADNTAFWNVWRLTPEIFRRRDGVWVVKYDLAKLDAEVLADKIEYIFSATLDVTLSLHRTLQATQTGPHRRFFLDLSQERVPVHRKADTTSEVTAVTPPGLMRLDTDYWVEGLKGDGPYWHISHYDGEYLLDGFIHANVVV